MRRFDWGPSECFDFHRAVKKYLFPIQDKLRQARKEGLGIEELRPYDGPCDIQGREPLMLYEKGDSIQLVKGAGEILSAMDDELFGYFQQIRDNGFLDLDGRKHKATLA